MNQQHLQAVSRFGQCVRCGHAHVVDCGANIAALKAEYRVVTILTLREEPLRPCFLCGCVSELVTIVQQPGPKHDE